MLLARIEKGARVDNNREGDTGGRKDVLYLSCWGKRKGRRPFSVLGGVANENK